MKYALIFTLALVLSVFAHAQQGCDAPQGFNVQPNGQAHWNAAPRAVGYVLEYRHAGAGSQNGPWNNPLMARTSDDGVTFGNGVVFQDSAGVASLAQLPSGRLYVAFQWFRQPMQGPTWDKVAVKYSDDNGATWQGPFPIVVNGFPANNQRPFDPTLAVTPEGRLRIFYSSSEGQNATVGTYSAISDDGINYTYEQGPRFLPASGRAIDPAALRFNNVWHYSSPKGAPQDGAWYATSTDGLNFTQGANIASDAQHNWTGNLMQNAAGEVRFYGTGSQGGSIWYATTTDGASWSAYNPTNVREGGDPSVQQLPNGSYLMVYTGPPAQGQQQQNNAPFVRIFTGNVTQFMINGLAPNADYEVRIRTICGAGDTSMAGPPFNIHTPNVQGPPPPPPGNCPPAVITPGMITPVNAEIRFTLPMQRYEVSFREVGAPNWNRIPGNTPGHFLIQNLQPNHDYEIQLRNQCGDALFSVPSNIVRIHTPNVQGPPPPPPGNCPPANITPGMITPNNAEIRFTLPMQRYEVSFREVGAPLWVRIPANSPGHFLIQNLQPNHDYEIQLRNQCGDALFSVPSNIVRIHTPNVQGPPPPPPGNCPPANITPGMITPNNAEIRFTLPMQRYEVSFREVGAPLWVRIPANSPGHFLIQNLQPNRDYEIQLRNQCGDSLFSAPSNIVRIHTPNVQGPPPPPPGNCPPAVITPGMITPNSVDIRWGLAFQMNRYEVTFREVGAPNWVRIPGNTPGHFVLQNLQPDRAYEIRVRNQCGDSLFSDFSNVVNIHTPPMQQAQPCPTPRNLTIRNISAVSASIGWQPDPAAVGYVVDIFRMNNPAPWRSINLPNTGVLDLNNLTRGTTYEARVRAVCGPNVYSPVASIRFTTSFRRDEGTSDLASQWSMYPNPSNGVVNLSRSDAEPLTLQVRDLSGRTVRTMTTAQADAQFDLSDLPAGIYLLQATTAVESQTLKLILQ